MLGEKLGIPKVKKEKRHLRSLRRNTLQVKQWQKASILKSMSKDMKTY